MTSIYSTPIEHLQELSIQMKSRLNSFEWSLDTMMKMVQVTMEIVETVKEIKGQSKKQLAIDLMHYCIDHVCPSSMPSDHKCELHAFVAKIVPSLIDTVVAASKGLIQINSVATSCGCL